MVESCAMKTRKTLTRDEWTGLILGLALLFGLIVRLFPGLMAGFPLNDGGMFLVMIRDLRANGFALPAFTGYNSAGIPFAYPPFGFYAAGGLSALGLSTMDLLRWLPPVVNFSAIFAIYILAAALLNDRARAAVAAVFFALTPGSYGWQIMGGGLTRAFGMAFLILAVFSVHRMFRGNDWRPALPAILFCSLAVLSHPEVSLATAAACALVWSFFGRTRRGTAQAALVAAGVTLVTSLWWGTVLAQHGAAPFVSVMHTGAYMKPAWQGIYEEFIAPTSLFTPSGMLIVGGLIWAVWKKQYFLPAWLLLPFISEPRSAPAMTFLPACILAALGLADALPYAIDRVRARLGLAPAAPDFTHRRGLNLALLAIVLYLFVQSAIYDFRLVNTSLIPPEPQQAMSWARRNTPPGSQFLILTGDSGIMTDPIQEWFPGLAERRSQTTLQGLEWTLGAEFFPRLEALISLQDCESVACVQAWSAETGLDYSHVLIQRTDASATLLDDFMEDNRYWPVYENPEVVIFER